MSGSDNLILGGAHIFDEVTKNENRKMNPLFFLFGVFFLFPRTAISRVQRRKGAKQIFCDGNFLEIMVYWL